MDSFKTSSSILSQKDYYQQLSLAIKNDDQCSIESLFNAPNGAWTIEQLLLSNKLDSNMQGIQKGHALIHWAVRANNSDVLGVLLNNKRTNLDIKNKNGCTALSFAVAQGKVVATHVLLDHKADSDILNENKHTLLHTAIMGYFSMGVSWKPNYFEIIKLLITRSQILVNAVDIDGKTALHYAVISRQKKIVKLLLSCRGIDLGIKDSNDKTALDYARENEKNDLVELLLSHR